MKRHGHQDYVDRLAEKLKGRYEHMEKNFEYKRGEIDLLGRNGPLMDIFEVKCHAHKSKAVEQLKRASRHFKGEVKDMFYYDGALDKLERI